jgi:hypothetical protein
MRYKPWPAGRMVLTVFASIANFERSSIVARTSADRNAAKAHGVRFGPPPSLSTKQIAHGHRLAEQKGKPVAEVTRLVRSHRPISWLSGLIGGQFWTNCVDTLAQFLADLEEVRRFFGPRRRFLRCGGTPGTGLAATDREGSEPAQLNVLTARQHRSHLIEQTGNDTLRLRNGPIRIALRQSDNQFRTCHASSRTTTIFWLSTVAG